MTLPTITFYSEDGSKVEITESKQIAEVNSLSLPLLVDLLKLRYRCSQRVFVRCRDQQQMLEIDEQLWLLDSHSFLAHSLDGEISAAKAPIVLGTNIPDNVGGFFCWVNLTETALLPLPVTREIVEIVSNDETQKQQARDRYKMYCKNGIKPAFVTHKIVTHKIVTQEPANDSQVVAHA